MKNEEDAIILKENFNNKKFKDFGFKIFVYFSNIKKLFIPPNATLSKSNIYYLTKKKKK